VCSTAASASPRPWTGSKTTNPTLTETERDFLAAGRRLSEAELRAAEDVARHQIRVNRRLRTALTTAAFLLAGALIAALSPSRKPSAPTRKRLPPSKRRWPRMPAKAGAKAVVQDDIGKSMLLGRGGLRLDDTPESRDNLLAVLAKNSQLIRSFSRPKAWTSRPGRQS
jgi:hypothetical protein